MYCFYSKFYGPRGRTFTLHNIRHLRMFGPHLVQCDCIAVATRAALEDSSDGSKTLTSLEHQITRSHTLCLLMQCVAFCEKKKCFGFVAHCLHQCSAEPAKGHISEPISIFTHHFGSRLPMYPHARIALFSPEMPKKVVQQQLVEHV